MEMTRESKFVVAVAVLASLLEIIDTSIVNVSIPTMMGNLGVTLEDISWVSTGYIVANAIVLPLAAWLGEQIGRRTYFISCILFFTFTSVACGLAPNLFFLTIFRVLQGLAGGALLPTSQTLIYEQFPKEKAGMAGAIFGVSVMIGPTLGPTLGGYLTDNFGWRSIFNINLPIGLLAAALAYLYVKEPERILEKKAKRAHGEKSKMDFVGLALLCVGIGCLQFVLERGEADDWLSSSSIVINMILAVLAIPTFIWWELKTQNPIINLRLFKESIVANGTLIMTGLGFFLYGVVFILPVFVTRSFHYDATQTGMLFIPGSILTAMVMPFVGKQMEKTDPRILIGVGLFFIEVFLFTLTQYSSQTSYSDIIFSLYIRGFAMAFMFVPLNSSILSQFKGEAMGQVSGLLNLFRQIGGSIGIAYISTVLTTKSHQNYMDVVSHVSLLNPVTQQELGMSVAAMATKMTKAVGFTTLDRAGLSYIAHRIDNQVFMMSFLQLMWIMLTIFAFTFIPLKFLKLKSKPTVITDSH